MKPIKPVRMWAVYNPAGDLLHWTLAYLQRDAIKNLQYYREAARDLTTWHESKADGYTVRRVWVSEEAPDGEA
jgi:hypothetical protein